MNRNHVGGYLSPARLAVCLSLLCLAVCNATAQTMDDYSAEPPFDSSDGNNPSGSISTISAVAPSGPGALYQSLYHKSYIDMETGKSISWGGVLQAIFMDESGRLREDNGIKGTLEDTGIDYVIDIFKDTSVSPARTRFRRFQQTGSGEDVSLNPVGAVAELATLSTIWNARDMLAAIAQEELVIQRALNLSGTYAEDAAGKRFIFTYLDVPGQPATDQVDTGEVHDFVPATFDPALSDNWRYLGLADQNDAMKLVAYVRGQDMPGWRSRLINVPGDAADLERYWILGDIVNSTPLVVGPPQERYDLVYGDSTYKKFKQHYAQRRQMIYTGANDGMLHAFNGGIRDAKTHAFQTAADSGTGEPAQSHALGAEMWAYVPMNLLPHLQWLKAEDYSHVYFVDGAPQAFDVNIFADDANHPGGWGTILVAGMRFGGGAFPLDLDGDGNSETTRTSAIIVMDITDPEKPSVLLAELTAPDLNFTTAMPTLIKARRPDSSGSYATPAMNAWVLMLGSGPHDLVTATSTGQGPTLFAWDLQARKYIDLSTALQVSPEEPPGFYGSLASVDHDNDYVDDALYAGTIEGTEQAPAGRLKRLALDASAPAFGLADGTASLSTIVDVAKPIMARPAFIHSHVKNEDWLLFGTGRSFTFEDYISTSEQGLFGIKVRDGASGSNIDIAGLVDATDILVQADPVSGSKLVWDGELNHPLVIDGGALETFDELFTFMDNKQGWYKRLQVDQAAERVVTDALFLRSSAIFTSFMPAPDDDNHAGESFVHALNYRTGTADTMALLGSDSTAVLRDAVSAGEAELAKPALNIVQGKDPMPDQVASGETGEGANAEAGATITLVAGSGDGGQQSIEFAMPASSSRRVSWELLASPF